MSAWIGGLRTMFNRIGFWIAAVNYVMITRTVWEFAPLIKNTFLGNYWFFLLGGFSVLVIGTMILEYTIFLPAEVKFGQYQAAREERNPTYRRVKETNERVKKLEARMSETADVAGKEIEKVHKVIEELKKDLTSKSRD